MYVVVEELIPEMSEGEHSNIGVILFAFGFTVMMALDVALSYMQKGRYEKTRSGFFTFPLFLIIYCHFI